jgi:hypothetical protein
MAVIAQMALGVIIGGLTTALFVTGFFMWNIRQKMSIWLLDCLSPEQSRVDRRFWPSLFGSRH